MCDMHYKRFVRGGFLQFVEKSSWLSPVGPYVKDCSETSSYYDGESELSSSASTPKEQVTFALATEPTYLLVGDVSFDHYRSLVVATEAERRSPGSESSPAGDLY